MFERVLHFCRCICEDKAYQYQSVQRFTEVIAQRCSVKNVFLENFIIKRGSRLHTCKFIKVETLAEVFSCEFCKISKDTFFYRTPLVAASGFIREYSYVKHISDFDSLQLSQKTQLQNT